MIETSGTLAAGKAALASADWEAARRHFEMALQAQDQAEAHDGLGIALWWLNEIKAAHHQRTLAFNGYRQQGNLRPAVRIAAWLAREQVFLNANLSAMQGWFARAERLLKNLPPCPEQGWYALLRASLLAAPDELERTALDALAIAQRFGDPDLEAIAIAFGGLARISLGRVSQGMADLDEAMVSAYSGDMDYMIVSEVFCLMLSACELAGDLARTEHWCQAADDYARQRGCPFLSAYCRTTYGTLLTAIGRWQEAETALTEAIQVFDAGHQGLRVHAVIRLADLRVWQGRLEEAEALLSGYEDHDDAAIPLARLYLARGETSLARAALEQALPQGQARSVNQAAHLRVLVDVLLAAGNLDAARSTAEQLDALARQTASDLLAAQAAQARGQVKAHASEEGALACFQSALDHLHAYEQSILASRTRLEMARLLQDQDPPAAITWARAALASFQRIGAQHDAEEAIQLLRRLGVTQPAGPRSREALSQREAEVYALLSSGLTNREIAGRLVLSPKTVEHHVTSILTKLGARSRSEAIAHALHGDPPAGPAK